MKIDDAEKSFRLIVGDTTYEVWKKMLQSLVPVGRSHSLAPIIAGMLQFAVGIANKI